MEGVINLYKEPGWTSGDAVNKLKGVLHQRRIGHCGTLDPDAEGVLVICVGKATKLFDFLTAFPKTYTARIVFGKTTDTQDGSGTFLTESVPGFSIKTLDETISSFSGKIRQIPPMYSAIHKNGQRLYELARKGETVEIEPREVEIYSISRVSEIENNACSISVTCSKGTYIRTICHDIGQMLGCGAYMQHLLRTSAAGRNVENSKKISEIEEMMKRNDLSFLVDTSEAIDYMPVCNIDGAMFKALYNGNPIDERYAQLHTDEYVRLYCDNQFFGIGKRENGKYFNKCYLGER